MLALIELHRRMTASGVTLSLQRPSTSLLCARTSSMGLAVGWSLVAGCWVLGQSEQDTKEAAGAGEQRRHGPASGCRRVRGEGLPS